MPDFVPVVAKSRAASGTAVIEIALGGTLVRLGSGVDPALLARFFAWWGRQHDR